MKLKFSLIAMMVLALSCAKKPEEASSSANRALYVASGTCLSGIGNTPPAATNVVYKVNLSTGAPGEIVADYTTSTSTPGDTPTGIVDIDDNNFLVLVENASAGARRLEKVSKASGYARSLFYINGGILASTLRGFARNTDGSIFFGRNLAIEKLNNMAVRQYANSTSWGLNTTLTGTSCGSTPAANFSASSIQVTPNGRTIFTNYFTAQSRVGVLQTTGFVAAPDCTSGMNSSLATAYPTASLYLPAYNQLLVLYAGANTAANNYISVYDFNDTTGVLSNEGTAFKDPSIIFGGSAMALDAATGKIYVATSNSNIAAISNYNIEQFSYDPTSRTMTRVGSTPFATGWANSKCISSMFIGN